MFRIHPTMGALWRGSRGYKQNESIVLCGGIDINIMNSGDHILISKDRRVLYFAFCFVLCCADAVMLCWVPIIVPDIPICDAAG